MNYAEFVHRKSQIDNMGGFAPIWQMPCLKDFQQHLVDWAIRKGRAALFEDCGLGKTPQSFAWAENVIRHTNKPVLIVAPLAVSGQTEREAVKFGIDAKVSRDGTVHPNITITNYERLHYFKPEDFSGVVCDESSAIKAMDGKTRDTVTEFLRTREYRLLCTATAAPNDYIELGTASEALGEMGQRDMITMFFVQENKTGGQGWARMKYRMKGHAEVPFWKWVSSWARACRRPSDLGFSNDGYVLPPLQEHEHVVETRQLRPGQLIAMPAQDMREEQEERRRTIQERCEKAAELANAQVGPSMICCHLNPEGDLLEKMIPGSRQAKGNQTIEEREEIYEAFVSGQLKKMILKPKVGAWGLNLQHCAHVVTFASHSYESRYQLIRRCWRFGQKYPVTVDSVITEGEQRISDNLMRKEKSMDRMFTALVEHMQDAMKVEKTIYDKEARIPQWLA